ncbi:peptidase M23 [Sporolactobacillus sp. THM7-7]|nr:peptidase M23 [Sporolactobacillus sp. THM7-7]
MIILDGKLIRRALAAGLAFTLTVGYSTSYTLAKTQDELEKKLDGIKEKQEENQNEIDTSNRKLSANQKKQDSIIDRIKGSEKKIHQMNRQIADKRIEVSQNEADIDRLEREISQLTMRINERNKLLKNRVRSMYISGGAVSYLDVLMGAKSFGNFVDRLLALKTIAEQDRKILTDQENDRKTQESKQEAKQSKLKAVKSDLATLQALKTDLDEEKKNQKHLLAQLKKEATDIHESVMDKDEVADILEAQEGTVKNQLAALAEEEAKKKAAAEAAAKKSREEAEPAERTEEHATAVEKNAPSSQPSSSSEGEGGTQSPQTASAPPSNGGSQASAPSNASSPSASSGFIMPTNGYMSSGFGHRSFDNGFHPGIDIANGIGTPVKAAADGVVFRAYQSSSYGNVVMITHLIGGQTYTTVYAHLSSYNVSTGQTVSQGQVIGAMGNTGESFGSHLHFELYQGLWTPPPHHGAVNPLNYIH